MKNVKRISTPVLFLLPLLALSQVWVNSDSIGVNMKNYGEIEIWGPMVPGDPVKQVDRITLLVGVDETAVFDYYEDADVDVASMLVAEPLLSDMEGFTSINNYYSFLPPDIHAGISAYAWNNAEYVIIKVAITNIGAAAIDARIGLDIISQIAGDYDGVHTWLPESNIIDMSREGENHIGMKFLSHTMTSLSQFVWFSGYSAAGQDAALWGWMNATEIDTIAICTNPDDGVVSIPSTPPVSINAEESIDFYYCVARGQTLLTMEANIAAAEAAYSSIFTVGVDQTDVQPKDYSLSQNFPNPFNPSTRINFTLPVAGYTSLKVFNLRGELVESMHDGWMAAGSYARTLDGLNLPSGIYVYSLTSAGNQLNKKMTLLR
ncbi:T9SS type A sorting domain-containing protein [bacterium]|nr:T9SS type A sorting domain-containing protein [bacterium]